MDPHRLLFKIAPRKTKSSMVFPKMKASNRKLRIEVPQNPKEKTEYIFSEKIREVINKDPNVKNKEIDKFSNTKKENWVPEGYIYYDFLLKHPYLNKGLTKHIASPKKSNFPTIKSKSTKNLNEFVNYENKDDNDFIKNAYDVNVNIRYYKLKNEGQSYSSSNLNILDSKRSNSQNPMLNIEKAKTSSDTKNNLVLSENKNKRRGSRNLTLKLNPSEKYFQSDIFNLKNNQCFTTKSSEKYLFRTSNNFEKYNRNIESDSYWVPKNNTKCNLLNYNSVGFNILNPSAKNNFINREDIKRKNSDINLKRVGCMSDFIDATREICPNNNEKYISSYQHNSNSFKKTNELCSCYIDNGLSYGALKPYNNE